jgi:dolichyl-diphosphooligosaccharide--protein glycosyltransferase
MLVAVIMVGRRSLRDLVPVLVAGVVLLVVVGIWKGWGILNPVVYLERLSEHFAYITGDTGASPFAAAGAFHSEQVGSSFSHMAIASAGGWGPFLGAALGLISLAWATRQYALFLVALVAVTALSVTGQRFLIFSAPLFGLGMGALFTGVWCLIKQAPVKFIVLILLCAAGSLGALREVSGYDAWVPHRKPILFEAMVEIRKATPPDAVIWAAWGHGHPLVYYGQRGTVGDGIFHPSSLQYALFFPLATSDFRLAANWIQFYVNRGQNGLKEANRLFGGDEGNWEQGVPQLQRLLRVGVEESRSILLDERGLDENETERVLAFLFPKSSRPVYFLLDYVLLSLSWYQLGKWDLSSRSAPEDDTYIVIAGIGQDEMGRIRGGSPYGVLALDLNNGAYELGDRSGILNRLSVFDGSGLQSVEYSAESGVVLKINGPGKYGVLADRGIAEAVLTKLYFEIGFEEPFFTPAILRLPPYSLWKVTGEPYAGPRTPDPIADESTDLMQEHDSDSGETDDQG